MCFPINKMVRRREVEADNIHQAGPSLSQTTVIIQVPEDCNDNTFVTNNEQPCTTPAQGQQYEDNRSIKRRFTSKYHTERNNSVEGTVVDLNESGSMSLEDSSNNSSSIYQGDWPIDRVMWNSGPSNVGESSSLGPDLNRETSSIMSFSSTASNTPLTARYLPPQQQEAKVEMVHSLVSMMGAHNKEDVSRKLLLMSSSKENCIVMRQTGCLPLLVQLLHGSEKNTSSDEQDTNIIRQRIHKTRKQATQVLHNIVHSHPDDKRGRREARVLRLLEQIREYCDNLRDVEVNVVNHSTSEASKQHPGPAIAALMKLSFDEEHRYAMCQLGGLHAIAELIQVDHEVHGNTSDPYCVTLRRYAGMALTNLTFGDGTNKALLCSKTAFIHALVAQLHSPSEDLRQVTASVLRNLSWRADAISKQTLREAGSVGTLVKAAIEANKESTLKSILSALWNLSAHSSSNKAEICSVDGALAFLVSTLTYKSPSKILAIIENGGGILRNISSHIAVREDYRIILRKHDAIQILLQHLKSPSLTVVSNACGTLWNLSARCAEDQRTLWEMGAVGMLRNLIHSKHKMISMGSSAALKNLLSLKSSGISLNSSTCSECSQFKSKTDKMPSLHVRKMKALESEIDQSLSETYDNLDSPKTSPTCPSQFVGKFLLNSSKQNASGTKHFIPVPLQMYNSVAGQLSTSSRPLPCSKSHDSLGSSQSEFIQRMDNTKMFSSSRKDGSYPGFSGKSSEVEWSEENLSRTDYNNMKHPLESEGQSFNLRSDIVTSSGVQEETPVSPLESGPRYDGRRTCWEDHLALAENDSGTSLSSSLLPKFTKLVKKRESRDTENDSSCDHVIDSSLKHSDESMDTPTTPPQLNQSKNPTKHKEQQVLGPYLVCLDSDTEIAVFKPVRKLQDFSELNLDYTDQSTGFIRKDGEILEETEEYEEVLPVSPKSGMFRDRCKQSSITDYSLKSYCTEGTSLNFSTASSVAGFQDFFDTEPIVNPVSEAGIEIVNHQLVDQELKKTEKKNNNEEKPCVCQNEKKEAIPIVFSRSSSLGSISTLNQHSIQNDHSPFVSDVRHTASKVVSKFPSQTMPSTHPASPKAAPFNLLEAFCIPCPETTSFPTRTSSSVCSNPNICQEDHEEKEQITTKKEDKNLVVERTPAELSRATCLSSLTSENSHPVSMREPTEKQILEMTKVSCETADSVFRNFITNQQHIRDQIFTYQDVYSAAEKKEKSDYTDKREDNLGSRNSSGTPNNDSSNYRNNTRLHSHINSLGSSSTHQKLSNIPIKSNNTRLGHHVTNIPKPLVPFGAAQSLATSGDKTTNLHSTQQRFSEDCFKVYKTENISLNLSDPTFLADLGGVSAFDKKSKHLLSPSNCDNQSDSSAFCDDNDMVLFQCIQSLMPNLQPPLSSEAISSVVVESSPVTVKSKLPHILVKTLKSSYTTTSQALNPEVVHQTPRYVPPKSVKPKHSHCCLNSRVHSDIKEEKHHYPRRPHASKRSAVKPTKNLVSSSRPSIKSSFQDSLQARVVEGTPVTFTRNDFLSSRSTEEHERHRLKSYSAHQNDKYGLFGCTTRPDDSMSRFSYKPVIPDNLNQKNSTSKDIPTSGNLKPMLVSKERQGTISQSLTKEVCPLLFKKNSSTEEVHQEKTSYFHNKETPTCFSRNGSMNSLNVEETFCSEQSFLHTCLASGIPKDKSVFTGYNSSSVVKSHDHKPLKECGEGKLKNSEQNIKEIQFSKDVYEDSKIDGNGKDNEPAQQKEQIRTPLTISSRVSEERVKQENVVFHEQEKLNVSNMECSLTKIEDLTALQCEALKIVEKVEGEVQDDLTQSTISCMSDIDNAKPPSIFIDLGSLSMMSSGISDIVSYSSKNEDLMREDSTVTNRRSKMQKDKDMQENVWQTLCTSSDTNKVSAHESDQNKTSLLTDSIDSLSMKGSTISEILENVNPPSFMDDISLVGSCESLNSISSDVLENRSQFTNEVQCTKDNDILDRLNAAASVVQMYSRELNTIMTGSMKSSYNSEIIDQVKPPSFYQDIVEVTAEDVTDFGSDSVVSDTELIDDLPRDDVDTPLPSTETLKAPRLHSLQDEQDGSTENLTYVLDECESTSDNKGTLMEDSLMQNIKSDLSISKVEAEALKINATLVLCTLNKMQEDQAVNDEAESQDNMLEDETISLVSNDSEEGQVEELGANEEGTFSKKPIIIKPLNKEIIRQMRARKETTSRQSFSKVGKSMLPIRSPRAVHGGGSNKNDANCSLIARATRSLSPFVRPTRTLALSTNQKGGFQNNLESSSLPLKTNLQQTLSKSEKPKSLLSGDSHEIKNTSLKDKKNISKTSGENEQDIEISKPKPLVKQGTFTKDKPTQDAPQISPMKTATVQQFTSTESEASDNTRRFQCKSKSSQEISKTKDEGNSNYSCPGNQIQSSDPSRTRSLVKSIKRPVSLKSFVSRSSSASSRYSHSIVGTYSTSNGSLSSSSSSGTLSLHTDNPRKRREVTSKIASLWKRPDAGTKAAEKKKNLFGSRNNSSSLSVPKFTRSPSFPNRAQSSDSVLPTALSLSRSSTYEKLSSENQHTLHSSVPTSTDSRKNQNEGSSLRSINIRNKTLTKKKPSGINSATVVIDEPAIASVISRESFLDRHSGQQVAKIPFSEGAEEQTESIEEKAAVCPFSRSPNTAHYTQSPEVYLPSTFVGRKVSDSDQQHGRFSSFNSSRAVPVSAVVPPFNYIPSSVHLAQQRPENM
ncbi:adenomatous polyposis coli homolog isoform X2 [Limulus polyphemus]|uniref:Adenomatous polyposis coli homolog isoform X2 n=1 Tax=Limulus polyphemus TaxID=6850 RepID=A0ABM1SQV7_LIMPO|nr:adenomatous polyposis coli homolog isoform X2 [Limulus polyphemus]